MVDQDEAVECALGERVNRAHSVDLRLRGRACGRQRRQDDDRSDLAVQAQDELGHGGSSASPEAGHDHHHPGFARIRAHDVSDSSRVVAHHARAVSRLTRGTRRIVVSDKMTALLRHVRLRVEGATSAVKHDAPVAPLSHLTREAPTGAAESNDENIERAIVMSHGGSLHSSEGRRARSDPREESPGNAPNATPSGSQERSVHRPTAPPSFRFELSYCRAPSRGPLRVGDGLSFPTFETGRETGRGRIEVS